MKTKPHVLYIGIGYNEAKIGVSSRMEKRVDQLKSGGVEIDIHCVWHLPGEARAVELAVMKRLASKLVRGREWFDVTPNEMVKVVQRVLRERNPNADVTPLPPGARKSSALRRRELSAESEAQIAKMDPKELEADIARMEAARRNRK